MKKISDEELKKIPIQDNGEELVDVRKVCPGIKFRLGEYIKKEGARAVAESCSVREAVAEKLKIAQSLLPKGHRLILRCGYRSLEIQKKKYEQVYNRLKKQNPSLSEEKLKDQVSECVAPVDELPPHSTGGAVDVSIVSPDGKMLDMGGRLGDFNDETPTDSDKISTHAKKNRALLVGVMTKAGFVNYPAEWWHWSYGDRYWAAVTGEEHSIYDGI